MSPASSHTPLPHLCTFADLIAIPEEERHHEVLDGELVQKTMAGGGHGYGQGKLRALLDGFDGPPGGSAGEPGGWWLMTDATIKLSPYQAVRPDLLGWRHATTPSLPTGFPITIRPDWVCELHTREDARRDLIQKRRIYAEHGVSHYWLIDLERQVLTVLRLDNGQYLEVLQATNGERVRAEPFGALELPVSKLFGGVTH